MLHATLTVVPASGPSPLRDQIAAARESATFVNFAVVPVQASGTPDDNGNGDTVGQSSARREQAGAASCRVASERVAELEPFLPGPVAEVLAAYEATGAAGEVTELAADLGGGLVRLVFLGTGDGSARGLRRAGAALGRRVAEGRLAVAALPESATPDLVEAFAEGLLLGSYRQAPPTAEPTADPAAHRGTVRLLAPQPAAAATAAVDRATVIAEAVSLARDLTNMPSGHKSPRWLAEQAVALAEQHGLRVRLHSGDDLLVGGFGGIVAVGSGSSRPPCLIELTYEPPEFHGHVVLVGKGITFDSGGISLKPLEHMKQMNTDMAGGAVVMAVLRSAGALGLRFKITGLVAAAENLPSGSAMRPGDVITQYGGRTVEVLNTDAEGRLVLADALAYADLNLDPSVMVDLATLTGAARLSLGAGVGAVFSSRDELAAALVAAGEATGERLWRLPLVAEYRDALDSAVADLAHMATRHYGRPGAIEAALFLREFTGGRPWAHLDIAGPARAAADDGEISKGATGFGTRLLLRWLTAAADDGKAATDLTS